MSRRSIIAVAVLLAACARVEEDAATSPALPSAPTVTKLDPAPGSARPDAHFLVQFSAMMDESQLVASTGRSETVVLASEANAERAAAAIARSRVTVEERQLFVAASAKIASDARSLELAPEGPLGAGGYYLLVSPRVRDSDGRKLQGNGARFQYTVAGTEGAHGPVLVAPEAGTLAPLNLTRVLARGAGRLSLVDAAGATAAGPLDAQGDVAFSLAGLKAGARLHLATQDGAVEGSEFAIADCARKSPVTVEGGAARLTVRDTSVAADLTLDGPAEVEVQVGVAASDPCSGSCSVMRVLATCAPPPCGPSVFVCPISARVEGLRPASSHALRVVVRDLQGFESRTTAQRFDTVAAMPRMLLTEVMAAPSGATPKSDGEYVEILNLGPGAARLDGLGLMGPDGTLRPLLATAPPRPVLIRPGERALAVGSSFDATRYPSLPATVPILRASTHRLLGSGLRDDPAPSMRLVMAEGLPVELASFPGGGPRCPEGSGLQRDESVPPEAQADWRCGAAGGTAGLAP